MSWICVIEGIGLHVGIGIVGRIDRLSVLVEALLLIVHSYNNIITLLLKSYILKDPTSIMRFLLLKTNF